MTKQLLKFANLAPQIVQAVGLFRSVKPGTRARPLEVVYETQDLRFRFLGPFLLGVDDMRVLQGIVAIASVQNPRLKLTLDEAGDDRFKKIQRLLSRTMDVHTTYDELCRTIGYDASGGSADTTIRNALERLFAVSVSIQPRDRKNARTFEAGHIFERLPSTEASQSINVKLCPLLAFAVFGGPGMFMRVDLFEARKLKTDITRLLHMHLAWIGPGMSRTVGLDKLVQYVYGTEAVTAATQRQRKVRVKAGLQELARTLNWRVWPNRDKYAISRPAMRPKPFST